MSTRKNSIIFAVRAPLLASLCIAAFVVALPKIALAQGWQVEPVIKFGVEYDDNADLNVRTDQEVSLEGLLLDLRADIEYSSVSTSFSLQPRALLSQYPDESDFDSEDFFLRSDFSHVMRSSTVGFRATFDQQSVRKAERAISDPEVEDPDDLTDDDTGRVLRDGDRNRLRFAPNWGYQLSSISSIEADLDYVDVEYDDVFASLLDDYSDARLSMTYRRSFSNVNTGLLTVTGRRYDPSTEESDTTGYGLMAGFDYALSEKTTLKAMVGFEQTDQSGFDYDPEATGYILLSRNLETIRMFARYRRSVSGSGAGKLTLRDSLDFNFRRRLSEKISAGLGVRAYQSSDVRGSTTVEDRDYVQLRSSFSWFLSPAWVIEADYRYTVDDRGAEVDVEERSNSNQVNLWLIYLPKSVPGL